MDVVSKVLTQNSIDDFVEYLRRMGRSENTIKAYRQDLAMFMSSCDGFLEVDDFNDCALYWIGQSRKTLAPNTVERRMCSLKVFAKQQGIPHNLSEYKLPVALKANPHPLPEGMSGIRTMLEHADVEDHRVIIALCGFAGLRISEALALREQDVDPASMVLTVRGKGDKVRLVPMSEACWDAIRSAYYYAKLINTTDKRLTEINDRSARRAITSIGRRARLARNVASHDLRATFATAVYNKTKNLRVVQELLGHSSITTTEIYLGVNTSQLVSAVNL